MKKFSSILGLFSLVVLTVCLCGCGSQEITINSDNYNDFFSVEEKYIVDEVATDGSVNDAYHIKNLVLKDEYRDQIESANLSIKYKKSMSCYKIKDVNSFDPESGVYQTNDKCYGTAEGVGSVSEELTYDKDNVENMMCSGYVYATTFNKDDVTVKDDGTTSWTGWPNDITNSISANLDVDASTLERNYDDHWYGWYEYIWIPEISDLQIDGTIVLKQ